MCERVRVGYYWLKSDLKHDRQLAEFVGDREITACSVNSHRGPDNVVLMFDATKHELLLLQLTHSNVQEFANDRCRRLGTVDHSKLGDADCVHDLLGINAFDLDFS